MTSQNWNRTTKYFGEVRPNEKLTFTFKYLGSDAYRSHNASCGCITTNWNPDTKSVDMTITTDIIPEIAKKNGRYHSYLTKSLTVNTVAQNGIVTSHTLLVKAIVIDPDIEI